MPVTKLRLLVFALCFSLVAVAPVRFVRAEGSPASAATVPADDVVFRATQDELARAVGELQLKDFAKPYFVEYTVLESEGCAVTGTFGAIVNASSGRGRTLLTQIRVGDYVFDNTEFAGPSIIPTSMVEDEDYFALRRDIWLASDGAYKQAVESLAAKKAYVQNRTQKENIPDFSKEKPTVAVAPKVSLSFDQAAWEAKIRTWSALFRNYPEIQESSVTFRSTAANKYLVNSEGTRIRQPFRYMSVDARASVQAADGMSLQLSTSFRVNDPADFPSDAEVEAGIRDMAKNLIALRAAPVISEHYVGPVLLAAPAAAEFVDNYLASELSGQRPSLIEQERSEGTQFSERLNRRVLPLFLNVYDDPTQTTFNGKKLFGAYETDDQGIPAQRVSLIEQGILKGLLMSRRPRKNMGNSNGHGRLGGSAGVSAQYGNLFVTATEGKTDEELKAQLISLCRLQNLEYGILIRSVDGQGDPLMAYKVYVKDGREELFRSATLGEFSVRAMKNEILAAGKTPTVTNYIAGRGFPIGYTIVAPAMLVEELELKPPTGTTQKPLLLTHPYFDKK
jgi:predicted Zn-dependent protease